VADLQIGNKAGFAAVAGKNINGGDDVQTGYSEGGNALTIAAMRARLTAINAGYFTASKLNSMTANDMEYAIRLSDHPSTIK